MAITKKKPDVKSLSDDELIDELMSRIGNGNLIGLKVWVASDINLLPENGYCIRKLKKSELKTIASSIDNDALCDCTDSDWDALHDAVFDACQANGIRLYKKEDK